MADTLAQSHESVPSSERRTHARQTISSLSYVRLDEGNGGIVLNVSEGGLSVQAVTSLMDDLLPSVRFQLPESDVWLEANARISWTGQSRRLAGLEFINLSDDSRNRIRAWLRREETASQAVGQPEATTAAIEAAVAAAVVSEADLPTVLDGEVPAFGPDQLYPPGQASMAETDKLVAPHPAPSSPPISAPTASTPSVYVRPAPETPRESPTVEPSHSANARPGFAASLFGNGWAFTGILALLAVGSLAAGWAAGDGKFGNVFGRVRPIMPSDGLFGIDSPQRTAIPAAHVSEIEVVNANNQRWTIPFDGPLKTPEAGARRPAAGSGDGESRKPPTGFQLWVLSPPQAARATTDGGGTVKESPPTLPNAPGGSENVLTASGSLNSQLAVAPPRLRVPDPLPPAEEVKPGQLIRKVDPAYPEIARERGVEGTVRLNVTIGRDGAVRDVTVLGGPRLLTKTAEEAVRQWRYTPTLVDGKPIEVQKEVDLRFHFVQPPR